MDEEIFNTDLDSEKAIKFTLERAKDLFLDNKELIVKNPILCPVRQLQALTMGSVLPFYVELVMTLAAMKTVFDFNDKFIEAQECERLISCLVLDRN